ncbi:MAG TPA: prenyltransferase/squalene oxidase repeat-containing protein [Bacillota bacterium]|nr:prenyltransferase/squalene oxidase repeat-containing protein [Bacillota bacterium]
MIRKGFLVTLAVALSLFTITLSSETFAETNYKQEVEEAIEAASEYILEKGVTSEWEAIGLVKAGKSVPESYEDVFYQNIDEQITSNLESGRIKITDIERLTIAAVALGKDPREIDGHNLIGLIYDSPEHESGIDTMTLQGNNGLIFALIALDTLNFEVPEDAKWTREKLIVELLENQNEDGSWALNPSYPDPSVDITAMAIIALSAYKDQSDVDKAIQKAINYLSDIQTDEGGFDGGSFVGGITSEAASQVIIGLTAYGIDPTNDKFTKEKDLIEHLLSYQNDDGGFSHTKEYPDSNAMATEQALQALVAYKLFLYDFGPLYDFTGEVKFPEDPEPTPEPEEPSDPEKPNPEEPEIPEEPEDDEKEESEDKEEKNIVEVKKGKDGTINVKPDAPIIINESTKIELPEDFPANTKLTVTYPKQDILKGVNVAGDAYTFSFDFPEGEHATGLYTLTMYIDEHANHEKVALYYFNEERKAWEFVGGEVIDGQIRAEVNHFSTYAVLSDEDAPTNVQLEIKEQTNDFVTLSFSADDFSGVDYYILYRNGEEIAQIPGTETIYTDENVVVGNSYRYEIVAFDPLGNESEAVSLSVKVLEELAKKESDEEGKELPKTATNMYTYVLAGFILFIIGSVLFICQRKKQNV